MRPASSPGTENLRANPSTKPSQIPEGRSPAGAPPRGLNIHDFIDVPHQIIEGRAGMGQYAGGIDLAETHAKPTSVPSPTPTGADRRPAGARTYTEGRV